MVKDVPVAGRSGFEAGSMVDFSLPTGPFEETIGGTARIENDAVPTVRPPARRERSRPRRGRGYRVSVLGIATCLAATLIGWNLSREPAVCHAYPSAGGSAAEGVVGRIVIAESGGVADAKNAYSSATGAGQFVDGTWLDLIRRHRPDLRDQSEPELLALRNDPSLSRDMVRHYAEGNAAMLSRHCLPVTAGTLYLSHFAGGAGAVAVLNAPEDADAAAVMAKADARGFITRAKIVAANPFLRDFTVADLKRWADRKMGLM